MQQNVEQEHERTNNSEGRGYDIVFELRNEDYDSLLFLQLIWKKGMYYVSFLISQNHITIRKIKERVKKTIKPYLQVAFSMLSRKFKHDN